MSKGLMQEDKRLQLKTNDEFSVEDCRSVSNSSGFQCIPQLTDAQSTQFEFRPYQFGETLCDKTDGTMNSTITFNLNDGCADRSRSGKTFLPSTTSTRGLCHSMSRRQSPEYYEIEVFIEKQNGLGYIVTYVMSRLWERLRWTNHEWLVIICMKEATRKDVSIA